MKKFIDKYKKWNPTKEVRLFLLFIPILLLFITFRIDNDFWFLLKTGSTILEKGFITTELFTIHSNMTFIPQQWLTDVIFYFIYNKLGIYGIFSLLLIINSLIIFIMYKLCLLITNNKIKLSLLITIILDFILEISVFTTRPQIFDILFILLEIYLLELYIKKKKNIYLIGLPIISLLMLNLHASIWPMVFIILIPYFLGKIKLKNFTKENYKLKPLIIVTIIMLLITLINPYKLELHKYLFTSYGISYINDTVGEMESVTITNGLIIYIYIFLVILSYFFNKNKINLRYLLLILGTTYLTLEHYKGILFFVIMTILVFSSNLKDYFKDENKDYLKIKYLKPIIIILIISLLGIFIFNTKLETVNNHPLFKVVNYLKENVDLDKKIYTSYNNGSYIEYFGYKVYLDPRAEVFLKSNNKKEDILKEYYYLQRGIINYKDFLKKYNFDYLVVDSNDLLYNYIEYSNYKLVYEYQDREISDKRRKITYRIYKRG